MFVATSTQGIGISYAASPATFSAIDTPTEAFDVSSGSSLCTTGGSSRTCTLTLPALPGTDDFQIAAWDQTPSSGSFASAKLLASSTLRNQAVQLGVANSENVVLDGVPYSVTLSVSPSSLSAGPTTAYGGSNTTATLSAAVTDADGNTILTGAGYTDANGNPLTLDISQADTSNGGPVLTTLSSSAITPSDTAITVTYPGGSTWGTVFSISPSSALAGTTNTATLSVTPTFTQFTAGTYTFRIASGSDGNLWITNQTTTLTKMTPAGSASNITLSYAGLAITNGPDGNLWVGGGNSGYTQKITTAGSETAYSIPSGSGITSGPDGNLWFTNGVGVAKITTSGAATIYDTGFSSGAGTYDIATGSDGNLWATENSTSKVARITTSGSVTEYNAESGLEGIAPGPDGNLWVGSTGGFVQRVTTAGVVSTYLVGCSAANLTFGSDGAIWFTCLNTNEIKRITTSGTITPYTFGSSGNVSDDIVEGADGNLWFTERTSKVGRLIY